MKRTFVRDLCFAAAVSLACTFGARACWVELSWSADSSDSVAVLTAKFASSTPVTAETYVELDETSQLLGLQLSMRDKRSDAVLAVLDLQQTLQESAQLLALLSEVSRQLAEMDMNVIRMVAGVASSTADWLALGAGAPSTEHTLVLTSPRPGFQNIVVPMNCQGACAGTYSSSWAFDRYVPEPGALLLVLTSLWLMSLVGPSRKAPPEGD